MLVGWCKTLSHNGSNTGTPMDNEFEGRKSVKSIRNRIRQTMEFTPEMVQQIQLMVEPLPVYPSARAQMDAETAFVK